MAVPKRQLIITEQLEDLEHVAKIFYKLNVLKLLGEALNGAEN